MLKDNYGLDANTGQPNFRIFTTKQTEKRYEEFNIFTDNGIFLRTEKGVNEVEKYPAEFDNLWVLERLIPTIGNPYLEQVAKLSYEPVWIFGAANSDKTPIWRAVRLLVNNVLNGGDPNSKRMSPSDLVKAEEERMIKEKAHMLDIIQDDSPFIPAMVHAGSGVFLDSDNFKAKGKLVN